MNEAVCFQGKSSLVLSSSSAGPSALGDGVARLARAVSLMGSSSLGSRLL